MVSQVLGEAGAGPDPHRHLYGRGKPLPYDEIQFIREGRGVWTVNGKTFEDGALRSSGLTRPAPTGGASPSPTTTNAATKPGTASPSPTLFDVIGAFKSISTIKVNKLLGRRGVPLWQRSYYEHIVRTGEDLRKIQRYILENPLMWSLDPENPNCKSS